MTRITNFGRKRTYLEAGFSDDRQDEPEKPDRSPEKTNDGPSVENSGESTPPPRKKRKRTKPSMRDGNTGVKAAEAAAERGRKKAEAEDRKGEDGQAPLSKSAKKKRREQRAKERKQLLSASERRRVKRIHDKQAATTCFACREMGHAAKDCPTAKELANSEDGKKASVVGICYRCGSTKHTLSRCKKPIDESEPLPFASCFVCKGKGHLASSCPQNQAKGVYPNGGCCKLCGETSHLAKDCGLRKRAVVNDTTILGTGGSAGADEDDFHSLKRQVNEVDQHEKRKEKLKRSIALKAGTELLKGHAKMSGAPPKKVVNF